MIFIDDDPATLRAVARTLRSEPYEVRTTEDPAQVLKWVGAGDVDLVVSDQRMPEMPGTELLSRVLERSPATACVLLTGYPESPEILESLRRGIHGVVTKPWEGPDLKQRIRQWIAKK